MKASFDIQTNMDQKQKSVLCAVLLVILGLATSLSTTAILYNVPYINNVNFKIFIALGALVTAGITIATRIPTIISYAYVLFSCFVGTLLIEGIHNNAPVDLLRSLGILLLSLATGFGIQKLYKKFQVTKRKVAVAALAFMILFLICVIFFYNQKVSNVVLCFFGAWWLLERIDDLIHTKETNVEALTFDIIRIHLFSLYTIITSLVISKSLG